MYKAEAKPDKKIIMMNGSDVKPLITLADEWGGRAQIIQDDNCYVLCLASRVGTYKMSYYWFDEAVKALNDYLKK